MHTKFNTFDVLNLIKLNLTRCGVLRVPDSTVCEVMPVHFQLAEDSLQLLHDPDDDFLSSSELKVVNMLAQESSEALEALKHLLVYGFVQPAMPPCPGF